MSTIIYDPFGFAVSSGGGKLLNATRQDSQARPSWETRLEPIHKLVGYQDWRILTSAARRLVNNFPILEGAMHAKAMHAVGRAWTPVFLGDDQAWGEQAKAWLEDEWFAICDVEGTNLDWKTNLFLNSTAIDETGDFAVVFTQTATGYPKLQHLDSSRIGQRTPSARVVGANDAWSSVDNGDGTFGKVKGLYTGFRIELGVISSAAGMPVAIRVLGESAEQDQDVSLRDAILRFDPRMRGQKRGLSAFAGAIEFLASSFEAHDGELRALIAQSFLSLIEYNEGGQGDSSDMANDGRTATQTQLQSWEKGMIKYFRAGSGQKLEIPTSNRPSPQWDSFNDRILRIALNPVWPYSLCWKPDGMNGTQERSTIELARAMVTDRQDLLFPVAKREVGWACSRAIKLGILPPYRGKDAGKAGQLKWGFEMPPEFNIDHGRESKAWLDLNLRGAANLTQWLASNGRGTLTQHLASRENESDAIIEAAKRTAAKHGISLEVALGFYRQTSPNPPTATAPSPTPEAQPQEQEAA